MALSTVNAIKIPLPTFEKRKEIADQIITIEKEMQKLEAEIASVERCKLFWKSI